MYKWRIIFIFKIKSAFLDIMRHWILYVVAFEQILFLVSLIIVVNILTILCLQRHLSSGVSISFRFMLFMYIHETFVLLHQAAKKHLSQRIENLDLKVDEQREITKMIKNEVCSLWKLWGLICLLWWWLWNFVVHFWNFI